MTEPAGHGIEGLREIGCARNRIWELRRKGELLMISTAPPLERLRRHHMALPANKVKIDEFTNGGEIVDIARDEVSANSSRC